MAATYEAVGNRARTEAKQLKARLDTIFAALGQGVSACLEARERAAEIEWLYAMSDSQLAAQGLKREQIPQHVYRDKLWL